MKCKVAKEKYRVLVSKATKLAKQNKVLDRRAIEVMAQGDYDLAEKLNMENLACENNLRQLQGSIGTMENAYGFLKLK